MRSRKSAMITELAVFVCAAVLLAALCALAAQAQIVEEKAEHTITITFSDEGVKVSPADPYAVDVNTGTNCVTILKKGDYLLTGSADEGQVVVSVPEEKKVNLELAGLDLHCSTGPALWIRSAEKAVVTLAGKTVNRLADSADYTPLWEEQETPNACLRSECDLDIRGSGALSVEAAYRNGIAAAGDLRIQKATVSVSAPYTALRAKTLEVRSAAVDITAYTNGIAVKSDDEDKGWLRAKNSSIVITAGYVGILTTGEADIQDSCTLLINSDTPLECGGEVSLPRNVRPRQE